MRYYADISVEWGIDMDADSEEHFIQLVKELYKRENNIELQDDEIVYIGMGE